jgi:hypothetical protein
MEYSQFIAQFSVLNEEELAYEALWKQGKLPPFPSFIALSGSGLADITLGDRLFFPTDDAGTAMWKNTPDSSLLHP